MSIFKSGTIINNRYEVVQGPMEKPSLAGGMGLVYLCVDHAEDGKPVALKTFRPELLSDRAARDRFLREGTTWVELGKHPHIVLCHSVFKANVGSEVFFALELVAAAEGKKDASLRSWLIPSKPLPVEQALLFALHICRGMVHATNKIPGLVHRDLKPENILIGRDGRARVTDFGLASAAQNLGSDWQLDGDKSSSHIRTQLTHGIAGTPLYMAPEQWKGEALDERADIYAFGCILYEMLSGSFAVASKNVEELKDAHCQGKLRKIPTELKEPLRSLLLRCLALNQADRCHSWVEVEKNISEVYLIVTGETVPQFKEEASDTRTDRIAVGWSYNEIGESYQDIGKFDIAHYYFEKVQTIAQKEENPVLNAAALDSLGFVYFHLSDSRRAIKFYEQSLAITSEIGNRKAEGNILGKMGLAYANLGNPRKAIEFYQQHLAIAREFGDLRAEGEALGNLGEAHRLLGNPHRAIEFHEKCLAIFHEISDRRGEGTALLNLGNAYFESEDLRQAMKFYEQDLSIEREIGNRHGEGIALLNLGNTCFQLGDPFRARKFYEQSLAIAREVCDRHSEGQILGNLGSIYLQLGEVRQAIEFYEQDLTIARDIGDVMGAAMVSFNIAILRAQQCQTNEAISYAKYALQAFTDIGNKQMMKKAQILYNKILSQNS